jgi:hypothetical protein
MRRTPLRRPAEGQAPNPDDDDRDECRRHSSGIDPAEAVDTARAGEVLGLAPKTLTNWRSLGIGPPYIKFGGRGGAVRYPLDHLNHYREAHLQKPATRGGRDD